jgi:hypothetical protein
MREVKEVFACAVSSPDSKCTGRSGWVGVTEQPLRSNGGCPDMGRQRSYGAALKMDAVVCAHFFFRRKGTKPILQVTVT